MTLDVVEKTGQLFGDLWHKLDEEQFEESVALFARRFEANGFDLGWLKGKRCLDAGCGGGRYSVAMARQGTLEVVGVDVSKQGIEDARKRSADIPNLTFQQASVLDLPFEDESFDFVLSSGVLHHTPDPDKGLDEVTRVLKSGGLLYLMLYGGGGLRWAASMAVRPFAQELGVAFIDRAIEATGLPANNRRHFLDDFFAPIVEFVTWSSLQEKLKSRGYGDIVRWGRDQHDQDENLNDVSKMVQIFSQAVDLAEAEGHSGLACAQKALDSARSFHVEIEGLMEACRNGEISHQTVVDKVIGEQVDDNHRIVAKKA